MAGFAVIIGTAFLTVLTGGIIGIAFLTVLTGGIIVFSEILEEMDK